MRAKFNEIELKNFREFGEIKAKLHLKYAIEYLESLDMDRNEKILICDEIIKILENQEQEI